MSNIYGLLTIGQTALMAQQKAIDITGNNIANVNTDGYSRQRLNLVQNSPVRANGDTMSMGVKAEQRIQRFYDQFLGAQLNNENQTLGRWAAQKNILDKVEVMFDETSGYGLNTAMSEYWNAWQNVSNNPSGHAERVSLVNAGQYLSSTFRNLRGSLTNLQSDIDHQVESSVAQVNQIAAQIADLNAKISQVEVTGDAANDYRDQRDQLTLQLAKLVDINSFEDGDGALVIDIGGGRPLVDKGTTWTISTSIIGGVQNVFWQDGSGGSVDITNRINDGELKGLIDGRDTVVSGYIGRLDSLAGTIIARVNALHSAGYALDGSQNAFFSGANAGDISVNAAVAADPNLIAAANAVATLPGDNRTAIAIANLQIGLTMSGGTATFDNFYNSLVGDVGSDTQSAGLNFDHQSSMINNLEARRQEVSGVSLDEEMVNLIKYQHAYNAAAKLITTTDELLDTLLGLKM
jgi:flagellar hook-associated protein 1 FlgK